MEQDKDKTPQPSAKADAPPKTTSPKQKPAKSEEVNKDKVSKEITVAKSGQVAKYSGKVIGVVATIALLMGALALVAGYYNYNQWQSATAQNQSLKGDY